MNDRGYRFDVSSATAMGRARRTWGRADVWVGAEPALPTYSTVADVLEKKNGSGWRLFGWTLARILMIAPPMILVGVPPLLALQGAALSSALISLFTMLRISHAATMMGVEVAR